MILVRVVPRSAKTSIHPQGHNSYKVKLTSAPVDGAANKQLLEVFAAKLSIPVRRIEILSGEHARTKRLRIHGADEKTLAQILHE